MIEHEQVWRAIDRMADAFGYSASGLAKKAGLDPTSFNRSKRFSPDGRPRWPSMESISKILNVTGATMSDFVALAGNDEGGNALPKHEIPVIGFAQAGLAGYFDEEGYPAGAGWDTIPVDQIFSNTEGGTYAIQVSGNSMEPLYRAGDLLIVSRTAKLRRGDRVVIRTRGEEVMVKELTRLTANRVDLCSFNPEYDDRSLTKEDVHWMARVMWVSQ